MNYFNCFVEEFKEEYKQSYDFLKNYTPNNIDQIYKYNNYETLKKLFNVFHYYNKTSIGELNIMKQFQSFLEYSYNNECQTLKDMLPINQKQRLGIRETYYNMNDKVNDYIGWISRYDKANV